MCSTTMYAVKFGKNSKNWVYPNGGFPGTGGGFPSSTNGIICPEYLNTRGLQHGDPLYEITSSGWSANPVATWDSVGMEFVFI